MNMQNLMAQAQRMQKDIQKKQSEIESTIFNGHSEFVDVEMYGSKKIHKISIKKDIIKDEDDLNALEDMILIAFNSAITEIEKETEKKLGSYSNSLKGLL